MTDYPQYPTDPAGQGSHPAAGMRGPRPASVDMAIKLIWANVGLSLISTIVTFLLLDSIVDAALEDAGVSGTVDTDTVRSGAIVGAIIGVVIGVAIAALLAHFLGKGANWARIVYTVFGALGILFSVFGLGGLPVVLLLLSLLSLAITAGAIFFLWKKESSAFFTGH